MRRQLAKILEKQANDESVVDADGNLVGESKDCGSAGKSGEEQILPSICRLERTVGTLTIF